MALPDPAWIDDVLGFWFGLPMEAWFEKSAALDAECTDRFQVLHRTLMRTPAQELAGSARQALAAVIVLDQFSRNMYRGKLGAFASDPLAREIARLALERGFDAGLSKDERLFLYLPFEHSEQPADQDRSVTLFRSLDDKRYLDYAIAHRDIIARFGRFPHRNTILGRPSSEEELAFLSEPGSSF